MNTIPYRLTAEYRRAAAEAARQNAAARAAAKPALLQNVGGSYRVMPR